MYRIAICDDEKQQRDRVRQLLLTLSVKSGIDFHIEEFQSGEQLVAYYTEGEAPFHILILDIEMQGLSGIETARKLRAMKRHQEQIVFLTSYAEYMLESFDVITFQYLLKPVEAEGFEAKMLKLCRYIEERDQEIVIIKSAYEEIVLRQEDIVSIEAVKSITVKGRLRITTVDAVYESKGLISSYASELKDSKFLQIHRSIIINLHHVHKFSGGKVIMSSGMELPIGRSKVKEVKDTCTKYMIMRAE